MLVSCIPEGEPQAIWHVVHLECLHDMICNSFAFSWLFLCLLTCALSAPIVLFDFHNFFKLDPRIKTSDRIKEHGYPAELHHVQTEDDYILGLYRIPYSHKLQNQQKLRPVVIIMHGLLCSSDNWISTGPNDALAFLLVDAGYDVWLGNARGNTYSRNHTRLTTAQTEFWRFSWHEIGYFDLSAMIDYALQANGQEQKSIHYIGHSQGTTIFFALMSTRPQYNAKIRTAHMLAPVAFMKHIQKTIVRVLGPFLGYYNMYSRLFGSREFLPYNENLLNLYYNICQPKSSLSIFCVSIIYDKKNERINSSADAIDALTCPAGISTSQFLHYIQGQQSGYFRHFDFGHKKNLEVYYSEEPPHYPTHLITSETHLWYSDNDEMSSVVDVMRLAETLPNKVMHNMKDHLWNHRDFVSNWEVRRYINDPVIAIIKEYDKRNKS